MKIFVFKLCAVALFVPLYLQSSYIENKENRFVVQVLNELEAELEEQYFLNKRIKLVDKIIATNGKGSLESNFLAAHVKNENDKKLLVRSEMYEKNLIYDSNGELIWDREQDFKRTNNQYKEDMIRYIAWCQKADLKPNPNLSEYF
jgi:hypothetical protein